MRQERSIKNLVFGLVSFAVTTMMGVIIPRLFILSYGSEVNGLISSVKQIFAYFTLLEAGVGTATQQALYGALSKNDKQNVSEILSATNSFYKRTGAVYAVLVLLLAIIYPFAVKTSVSPFVIVPIILFQGEGNVVSYLVTAKLQLLLNADGKGYICTNIGTIVSILSNLARIALLSYGFGVLWVQGVFCVIDIFRVIFIVLYTRRHYGWLDLHATPDYESLSQKNSVVLHQVSGLIFNNTDTIILTYFCGLQIVSVYSMYAMFYAMVANIIGYVASSVVFALGQLFHEDRNRFCKIQETYETYFLALSFALFSIASIFILPFLRLYTNGVTDINYIDEALPILFYLCQVLDYGRKTSSNLINFGQHFKQTRGRSILEMCINLIVSLCAVVKFGIYGVLFGTIAALFYRTNDMILYANHVILQRSAWPTYRRWIRDFAISIICIVIGRSLPQQYAGYVHIIVVAIPVTVVVIFVFFAVNTIMEKDARKVAWGYVKPMLSKLRRKE